MDSAVAIFEEKAQEYDAWFENSPVFAQELACLCSIETFLPTPKVEIGVGPGRFAERLGIRYGIDGAFSPLLLARKRGVQCCRGLAEELPLVTASCGSVFLFFTMMFLQKPGKNLMEIYRVLQPGGVMVVAEVASESSWGRAIAVKKKQGNLFYKHAMHRSPEEYQYLFEQNGFECQEIRSTLLPERKNGDVCSPGIVREAGCNIWVYRKGT